MKTTKFIETKAIQNICPIHTYLQHDVVYGHLNLNGERVPGLVLIQQEFVVDVDRGQCRESAAVGSLSMAQRLLVTLLGLRQLGLQ